MKILPQQNLAVIAGLINATFTGPADFVVSGINEIHKVEQGDLTFVDHPKYYDKALNSAATTILINQKVACPPGKALLFSEDPFRDYNFLTKYFRPLEFSREWVSPSAVIGEGTVIMPGAFVGNHVSIGSNCIIYPNVSIYDHSCIGDAVIIHSGTVIGADAFYFKNSVQAMKKCILVAGLS